MLRSVVRSMTWQCHDDGGSKHAWNVGYKTKWRNTPEDSHLNAHCGENLKSQEWEGLLFGIRRHSKGVFHAISHRSLLHSCDKISICALDDSWSNMIRCCCALGHSGTVICSRCCPLCNSCITVIPVHCRISGHSCTVIWRNSCATMCSEWPLCAFKSHSCSTMGPIGSHSCATMAAGHARCLSQKEKPWQTDRHGGAHNMFFAHDRPRWTCNNRKNNYDSPLTASMLKLKIKLQTTRVVGQLLLEPGCRSTPTRHSIR